MIFTRHWNSSTNKNSKNLTWFNASTQFNNFFVKGI